MSSRVRGRKLMGKTILQEQQRTILQQERRLVSEIQACLLADFEGADASTATLRQVSASLDELFLLVVVGEFNTGKSSCINALLHQQILEEGVIPTTHEITLLRYGEVQMQRHEQGLLEIHCSADFLQD